MSEAKDSTKTDASPYVADDRLQDRGGTPRKLLIFTTLFYFVVFMAFGFSSFIDDVFASGQDVIVMVFIFGSLAIFVLWAGWFLLLSGWNWASRIIATVALLAVPYLLGKVFRPVNDGDANIARFEPIWMRRPEVTAENVEPATNAVDLLTETVDDFPQFLGPTQNGVARSGIMIDDEDFSSSKVLWKQPIGKAWSGFSARNGFAVTMEQRESLECVTCYRIDTGQLQWLYSHPARHQDAMNLGRLGPRATPTIHNGMVYSMGAVGNLVCLNGEDGNVVWQVDLNEILGLTLSEIESDGYTIQHEAESSLAWGRSGAPLMYQNLVIVPGGGTTDGPKSTLLAFDKVSGELQWKGGSEMIAYGSPVIATVADVEQILLTAETKVMSFDPTTGDELWDWPRPGASDGSANTSQVTIVNDTDVVSSKGYPDGGGERIHIDVNGGKLVPSRVWRNDRALKTKLMSPVVLEGNAYSLSNGFLECLDLESGKRVWKQRGRFGHGQLLLVGRRLLVHSESGVLYLVRATPDGYEELGTVSTVEGVCWNTICLYGNQLLVRSELEAACVEIPLSH